MLLSSTLSLVMSCCETFTAFVLELANGPGAGAIIEVSTCFIVLNCCIGGGMKIALEKLLFLAPQAKHLDQSLLSISFQHKAGLV